MRKSRNGAPTPPGCKPDESNRRGIAGDARGSALCFRPASGRRRLAVKSGQPGADAGHAGSQLRGRTSSKQGKHPFVIARKYGVKLEALMAANPKLDARHLQVGQALTIPAP